MDPRIFRPEPMGLREEMLQLPLDLRFSYDEAHNILFLNFAELVVKTDAIIEKCKERIRWLIEPLGHRVYAIVNYDGFVLDPEVEDACLDALKEVGDRYFYGVTRFATSAFMRSKLRVRWKNEASPRTCLSWKKKPGRPSVRRVEAA